MKTIVIAQFKHETNCFSPFPTLEEDFRKRNYLFGNEVLDAFEGVRNEIGAFLDFFHDKPDIRIVPVCALDAMPQGKVDGQIFNLVQNTILNAALSYRADGVLLSLHGAMVTEQYDDGEGILLEQLRNCLGKEIPLIASIDLHANLTEKMLKNATALFGFHLYPHTDMYETGWAAAKCMYGVLNGTICPVMVGKHIPILLPAYMTNLEPIKSQLYRMRQLEQQPEILHVNVLHGFYSADIAEEGMSSLVVTNGKPELAQELADSFASSIYDQRRQFHRDFIGLDQALETVLQSDSSRPWVLADVSDNPGGGAAEDTTHILRGLLDAGITNAAVAAICDPETVERAMLSGCGSRITVSLGGKTAKEYSGGPLQAEAYVERLTDGFFRNRDEMGQGLLISLGKTALLRIDGIEVIVISNRVQTWDAEIYRHIGIMPEDKRVLTVKSCAHFQNSFSKITDRILFVSVPGFAAPLPNLLSFSKCPRPIYPLDDI